MRQNVTQGLTTVKGSVSRAAAPCVLPSADPGGAPRNAAGEFNSYYNAARTHRALCKDAPVSRPVQRGGTHRVACHGRMHHGL